MNPKKQPPRGPRPPRSAKPSGKKSKHYWHRRCYPWYDYDYDYDYDWDDDYDYTDWDFYTAPRRSKADAMTDPVMAAYQQGFKDGWIAAMEYSYYGEENAMPEPPAPAPVTPANPAEKPAE